MYEYDFNSTSNCEWVKVTNKEVSITVLSKTLPFNSAVYKNFENEKDNDVKAMFKQTNHNEWEFVRVRGAKHKSVGVSIVKNDSDNFELLVYNANYDFSVLVYNVVSSLFAVNHWFVLYRNLCKLNETECLISDFKHYLDRTVSANKPLMATLNDFCKLALYYIKLIEQHKLANDSTLTYKAVCNGLLDHVNEIIAPLYREIKTFYVNPNERLYKRIRQLRSHLTYRDKRQFYALVKFSLRVKDWLLSTPIDTHSTAYSLMDTYRNLYSQIVEFDYVNEKYLSPISDDSLSSLIIVTAFVTIRGTNNCKLHDIVYALENNLAEVKLSNGVWNAEMKLCYKALLMLHSELNKDIVDIEGLREDLIYLINQVY